MALSSTNPVTTHASIRLIRPLQELEKIALESPEPVPASGHQERYEQLINYYL